jgi:hypothetical protein
MGTQKTFNSPSSEAQIINAHTRFRAVELGFIVLGATICVGLLSFVGMNLAHMETNTLREWLQTTIASEAGLVAAAFGWSERS